MEKQEEKDNNTEIVNNKNEIPALEKIPEPIDDALSIDSAPINESPSESTLNELISSESGSLQDKQNDDEKNDDLSEDDITESEILAINPNYIYILPSLLILTLMIAFLTINNGQFENFDNGFKEFGENLGEIDKFKLNILSDEDISSRLKDTVYTEKDSWLELRIDQQMLYQHFRNGKVISYPVSTGNKYLSRSVESRPGLFAIFYKNAHHQSSQYNGADMYHFMPFNQGIGFHSLNGTGYYGSLGKAPSSHGCIRMRHEDAKRIFDTSPMGTLVLAHNGYTARVVGFAPKEYENPEKYDKEDYKLMLASNLQSILEGNYYRTERKFFVVDPAIIPPSGIYISYNKRIPDKQKLPKKYFLILPVKDRTSSIAVDYTNLIPADSAETNETLMEMFATESDIKNYRTGEVLDSKDLVNKYFKNPIGVLPYFGPNN